MLSVCLSMFCNFVCESDRSLRDETGRETFGCKEERYGVRLTVYGCKEKRCRVRLTAKKKGVGFDRQYIVEVIVHCHYHMRVTFQSPCLVLAQSRKLFNFLSIKVFNICCMLRLIWLLFEPSIMMVNFAAGIMLNLLLLIL